METQSIGRPPRNPTARGLYEDFIAGNSESEEAYEEAAADMEVAQLLYDERAAAGLTQKQLADLVGTSPSHISRLEDADYEGHTLALVRRIAIALGKRLVIRFEAEAPDPAALNPARSVSGKRGRR